MQQHSLHVQATQRAWSIYLSSNGTVDPCDGRRCTLERFLHQRWLGGETDLEELTCLGLSYLSRLPVLEILPDQW
jgi:hypothetical protein